MKKLLLASVGLVAMATAATAADLPARMPTKAPAYVAPLYNWTGFYIGAHAGWGWADMSSSFLGGGGRDDGFIYGGQMGFNYQVGQFVLGIEGDLSGTDIGSSASGVFTPGLAVNASAGVDWVASISGRVGVAFGAVGNWLAYGKAGVAWIDQGWSANVVTVPGGATVATVGSGGSSNQTGWLLGVGLEYGFTPNWSAKLEYNYLDFGNTNRTVTGTFGGVPFAFTDNVDLSAHIVKAGINYRFGTW